MFVTSNRLRWSPHWKLLSTLLLTACGGGYGGGSGNGMAMPPNIAISVAPTTITLGQSATVTWSAATASGCTQTGGWAGSVGAAGSQNVTPISSGMITFTLTCMTPTGSAYAGGGGASAVMSTILTVNPASAFSFTKLVADLPNSGAATTDANLVNPWGIVFAPGAPVWVANNHSETSTLYDGNGIPQPAGTPLVVQLPPSAGGVTFDPTGIVFNGTTDFVVTSGATSAAAKFIYSGEGGMIAGWAPAVSPSSAITMYTDTGGAVYKGLALANNGSANYLYATDFHNNKIDVFDATFTKQTPSSTSFAFVDATLPAGYAPFGIQAISNGTGGAVQLYVAYAMQLAPDNHDNADGAGLGLIDIFDANGNFIKHLVTTGGALNAPWGLALAPADFGTLSNALLVGNFGDGKINGYDPNSGVFMGAITDSTGTPFAAPGLWGIDFGNDAHSQPHNTLFFAAGINDEADGSYGRIDLGPAPTLMHAANATTTH